MVRETTTKAHYIMTSKTLSSAEKTLIDSLVPLKNLMVKSYASTGSPEEMIQGYADSISFVFGKKYIKVMTGTSVWGFIVNVFNDSKFEYGTLLKPASYSAPARNFSRGNLFRPKSLNSIKWTSAL